LGFLLGGTSRDSVALLFFTLLGVGSATGGAAVLNNYLERDFDAKMFRTRNRALPAGLIEPFRALTFGVGLVLGGVMLLAVAANDGRCIQFSAEPINQAPAIRSHECEIRFIFGRHLGFAQSV